MAIVFEADLKKSISAGVTCPVYLLFGEDGFLKKSYSKKIGAKIADSEDVFNYCRFDSGCNLQELYDFVLQFPMMSERKFAELYDFDFEKCEKSELERLCTIVSQVPDTAVLVLRFDGVSFDLKKSANLKKLRSAVEKNGGMVVNLAHRKAPELIKMLTDGAAKRGCKMEQSAARLLVEQAGEDINLLTGELEKLCAFVNKGIITKETVEAVCSKTVEASVYNLSRYIFECNIAAALKVLDELFFMRLEPIIIFYSIFSPYVDIYRVHSARQQGLTPLTVAEDFEDYKTKGFLIDKASENLRKLEAKQLKLSLDAILEAEKALKSFRVEPRIILEQLIVKLIYIIKKGEAIDKA